MVSGSGPQKACGTQYDLGLIHINFLQDFINKPNKAIGLYIKYWISGIVKAFAMSLLCSM